MAKKQYLLDDGTYTTTDEVAKRANISYASAVSRLGKSRDPNYLFSDRMTGKKYTLDDGSVWTPQELADYLGINKTTAHTRLSRCTDPERVMRPVKSYKRNPNNHQFHNALDLDNKMWGDKHGHWKLINKCL